MKMEEVCNDGLKTEEDELHDACPECLKCIQCRDCVHVRYAFVRLNEV